MYNIIPFKNKTGELIDNLYLSLYNSRKEDNSLFLEYSIYKKEEYIGFINIIYDNDNDNDNLLTFDVIELKKYEGQGYCTNILKAVFNLSIIQIRNIFKKRDDFFPKNILFEQETIGHNRTIRAHYCYMKSMSYFGYILDDKLKSKIDNNNILSIYDKITENIDGKSVNFYLTNLEFKLIK